MPFLTVDPASKVEIHYEDSGSGKPVVLIHGWPLSGRAWEAQIAPLVASGHRVITYDRRGFGQSSQPWDGYEYDTFAADLKAVIDHLDLSGVTLVGFSMGGGEVARYIGTYGTDRIAKAVLAAAVPPCLYKTEDNPDGPLDDAAIDGFRSGVINDRLAFLDDFTKTFFSAEEGNCLVSESSRKYHRQIASFASPKGTLDCIDAFSKTDFREDLRRFDVPTLIIHGDSDSIVPFEVSGERAAKEIPDSEVALIKGGPHGINATHAAEFNKALVGFLR